MGCTMSKDEMDAISRSKEIDKWLKENRVPRYYVILIDGTCYSGKDTILNQFRITYGNGYTQEDYGKCKYATYENIAESMRNILRAMTRFNISFADPGRLTDKATVCSLEYEKPFSVESLEALKRLWSDPGVQECFARSNEYELNDSTKYFLDDLDRIGGKEYIPTEQDFLRRTYHFYYENIVSFETKSRNFILFDRFHISKAKKRYLEEGVAALIFCVGLSDYDEANEVDSIVRMNGRLENFRCWCKCQYSENATLIVFLNKKDLFEEKIKKIPLTICFPEYSGGQTYEECVAYIKTRFASMNWDPDRDIYFYETCALDSNSIRSAFDFALVHMEEENKRDYNLV